LDGRFSLKLKPIRSPESGFTPAVGVWYHLAGVYDAVAQTASLYVNGALADKIFNVAPRAASGNTGIGRGWFNDSATDFNDAAIDDVRFYEHPGARPD
jgi:hypothetical protein